MKTPKCYTWLESCGSQLSDGKNEKLFVCILQSVGFSMTLRTDICLYTEKLSYRAARAAKNLKKSITGYSLDGQKLKYLKRRFRLGWGWWWWCDLYNAPSYKLPEPPPTIFSSVQLLTDSPHSPKSVALLMMMMISKIEIVTFLWFSQTEW